METDNFQNQVSSLNQILERQHLLRLIEKKIDEIKNKSSKDGWTSWTLLGALITTIGFLLNELKSIQDLILDDLILVVSFVYFGWRTVDSFFSVLQNKSSLPVKKGHINHYENLGVENHNLYIEILHGVLILILIYFLNAPIWLKTLLIPSLIVPFSAILIKSISYYGKNLQIFTPYTPVINKSFWGFTLVLIPPIIGVIILFSYLKTPIGQQNVSTYITSGLVLISLYLIENLVKIRLTPKLADKFEELFSNLLLFRMSNSEALNHYRILTEGYNVQDYFAEVNKPFNALCLETQNSLYEMRNFIASQQFDVYNELTNKCKNEIDKLQNFIDDFCVKSQNVVQLLESQNEFEIFKNSLIERKIQIEKEFLEIEEVVKKIEEKQISYEKRLTKS